MAILSLFILITMSTTSLFLGFFALATHLIPTRQLSSIRCLRPFSSCLPSFATSHHSPFIAHPPLTARTSHLASLGARCSLCHRLLLLLLQPRVQHLNSGIDIMWQSSNSNQPLFGVWFRSSNSGCSRVGNSDLTLGSLTNFINLGSGFTDDCY